jgi:predicted enzyme related to lactoylglutathione lyase
MHPQAAARGPWPEDAPMTIDLKPGAVVFAKDLQRMARFYERVFSLAVTHAGDDHVVLESARQQLVIHAMAGRWAKGIHIGTPPARRVDAAVKLFFAVDRIDALRATAAALGGQIDPPARAWEARGFRAVDGHDPEGNVLQLREALPG